MTTNSDQRDFWRDEAGAIWVDQRAAMDEVLAVVLDGTLARAQLETGHCVLDIGCGAGTSTLAVADAIGEMGHVTGFDISSTLLGAAQVRTGARTNIAFMEADAQTHPFVPQSADAIISRFGVIFFEDSTAAFRNMATALRPGGAISFSAWGAIADNPFFTLPAQIARQVLGPLPKSDPDAPGPFAFRNPVDVTEILHRAYLNPEIETVQVPLHLPAGAQAMAQIMCAIGPAHLALVHYGADASAQTRLMEVLVDALSMYETGVGITLPAQINFVTARKSP